MPVTHRDFRPACTCNDGYGLQKHCTQPALYVCLWLEETRVSCRYYCHKTYLQLLEMKKTNAYINDSILSLEPF